MWDAAWMDVERLGPLRVRKVLKAGGTTAKNAERPPLTVVLMHGYGAPGDDLVSLAEAIEAPAGTTFLFPEAPSPLAAAGMLGLMGEARAWWPIDVGRFQRAMMRGSLDELMEEEVPAEMGAATEGVVAMLDALERETGPGGSRVVLGGFSQGSMLALDVALRTKRAFAGLALLSSTLLARSEWVPLMEARKGLAVFQSHGTEDMILPYPIAEALRDALAASGLDVRFTSFVDGHGIPPKVTRELGLWLSSLG
jgi:phospholipase/carboxylesterase